MISLQTIRVSTLWLPLRAVVSILVTVLVVFLVANGPARAATDIPSLCDAAASRAASEAGIPADILHALTRTETGRTHRNTFGPWPWTVNMEGVGHWFETEDEAKAFVFKRFKTGARSFDVGCFQINYRWHGQAFESIEDMFDPLKNAQYAARFLSQLYAETSNWTEAAGAYHSRNPQFANRYKDRFRTLHSQLAVAETAPLQPQSPRLQSARKNDFLLLRSGQGGNALGSLVPHIPRRAGIIQSTDVNGG